ncbi:hypothetical protein T4E_3125, partial [Trichinella pseudospiralis]
LFIQLYNKNILKMSELYNENHLESMNNIDQNTIHSITSKFRLLKKTTMQLWNKLPLNFGYWQSKYFGKLFVCSFFLSGVEFPKLLLLNTH